VDTFVQRAQKREKRDMAPRQYVCVACAKPTDTVLGGLHSELPCERCGMKPCVGAVVLLP